MMFIKRYDVSEKVHCRLGLRTLRWLAYGGLELWEFYFCFETWTWFTCCMDFHCFG